MFEETKLKCVAGSGGGSPGVRGRAKSVMAVAVQGSVNLYFSHFSIVFSHFSIVFSNFSNFDWIDCLGVKHLLYND